MILVLSEPSDPHAAAVQRHIARMGQETVLLDTSRFPREASLVMEPGRAGGRTLIRLPEGDIDLSRARAVWWRRPQPYGLHPEITDPVLENFALHEVDEAIEGLWQSLSHLPWLNPPARDRAAGRKVWQLDLARACGLPVPRTLVTNDPAEARVFVETEGVGRTIYKPFQGSEAAWRETRLLRVDEVAQMETVKYAPLIFQEYLEAEVDLRVTVVDGEIFAAAIHSQAGAYKVDFRMDMEVEITPDRLSPGTEDGIRRLMERLGLVYGALDFRRRPDGEEVFIEINPAGQWLFVEDRTAQPIASSIAGALVRAASGGAAHGGRVGQ